MSHDRCVAMITWEKESPTPVRWAVRRRGRVVAAEVISVDGLWRFRVASAGDVVLQRCFVSLSSADQYWRMIREALAHDGWR